MTGPEQPLLRVVRGAPTPEQLAALVAVVTSRAAVGGATAAPGAARPAWAVPVLRTPLAHGPDGWRVSGLPR